MKAQIYRPAKTATQSGRAGTKAWVLEYEPVAGRQPEPLMGWGACGDTLGQVRICFDRREDAVAFAKAQEWQYTVSRSHGRVMRPRNYGDNFRYRPMEEENS